MQIRRHLIGFGRFVLFAFIIISINGCSLFQSPFDYPLYPEEARYVGAIERYNNQVEGEIIQDGNGGSLPTQAFAYQHLFLQGHYLFVGQCGLTIFDLALPEKPQLTGVYEGPCDIDDLFVVGDRAFLASRTNGVTVLNVSDISNPQLLTAYEEIRNSEMPTTSVIAYDNFVFWYTPISSDNQPTSSSEESVAYAGWYGEEPRLQILRLREENNGVYLELIQEVTGIGKPFAVGDGVFYANAPWQQDGDWHSSYLQSVRIGPDGRLDLADSILINRTPSDLQLFNQMLFGAVGGYVMVWEVTQTGQLARLSEVYSRSPSIGPVASGQIGNFGYDIFVRDGIVVGSGYTLHYQRFANYIWMRPYARFHGRNANCQVIGGNADTICKSVIYGKSSARPLGNPVLYEGYIYTPYTLAESAPNFGEFTVLGYGVDIYSLP
ncbi:MAG: hypothetical protein H6642_15470 [Caldilineaceae bacterium]|nr:hypothetical protein [Caldilineaceae bacterium]